MELCDRGHEEVCFECENCPVCELSDKMAEVENERDLLKEEVAALKERIEKL